MNRPMDTSYRRCLSDKPFPPIHRQDLSLDDEAALQRTKLAGPSHALAEAAICRMQGAFDLSNAARFRRIGHPHTAKQLSQRGLSRIKRAIEIEGTL